MKSYLIALVCMTGLLANGQSVDIIFPPIMETQDSWHLLDNCAVVNELESRLPVKVELTVVSEEEGLLFSGVSTNKFIQPGLHNFTSLGLNISAFLPVYTRIDYDGTFGSLRTAGGGNLSVCLTAHLQYELPVSTKTCQDIGTREFESLHLITPADGSIIESEDFNYTWTPGSGLDLTGRNYYFKIIEVEPGEEHRYKTSKFHSTRPFYEGKDIPFPVRQNEDLGLHYQTDKVYVWTVALIKPNGEKTWADEIWSFQVEDPTTKAYYLVPKRAHEEVHYQLAYDLRLRFLYETRYSNDHITVTLYDLNNKKRLTDPVKMYNIKPGLNQLHLDLWKYLDESTEVILVTITNSKGKKQYLKVRIPKLTKDPTYDILFE